MNGAYKKINESNIEAGKLTKTTDSTGLPSATLSIEMESLNNQSQQQEQDISESTINTNTNGQVAPSRKIEIDYCLIFGILFAISATVALRFLTMHFGHDLVIFEIVNALLIL